MKILSVKSDNRRKSFDVHCRGKAFVFPFAKCSPRPSSDDAVIQVHPDPELGREAFTYVLKSGEEGSVHMDQVLEYNRDPGYLRDQVVYDLTLEAIRSLEISGLSKRETMRRLGTSAPQLYRLLDPAMRRKSVDQLLRLLAVLGQEVQVKVLSKSA